MLWLTPDHGLFSLSHIVLWCSWCPDLYSIKAQWPVPILYLLSPKEMITWTTGLLPLMYWADDTFLLCQLGGVLLTHLCCLLNSNMTSVFIYYNLWLYGVCWCIRSSLIISILTSSVIRLNIGEGAAVCVYALIHYTYHVQPSLGCFISIFNDAFL